MGIKVGLGWIPRRYPRTRPEDNEAQWRRLCEREEKEEYTRLECRFFFFAKLYVYGAVKIDPLTCKRTFNCDFLTDPRSSLLKNVPLCSTFLPTIFYNAARNVRSTLELFTADLLLRGECHFTKRNAFVIIYLVILHSWCYLRFLFVKLFQGNNLVTWINNKKKPDIFSYY